MCGWDKAVGGLLVAVEARAVAMTVTTWKTHGNTQPQDMQIKPQRPLQVMARWHRCGNSEYIARKSKSPEHTGLVFFMVNQV